MAVVVEFKPESMTYAQYDKIMQDLESAGALGNASGLSHVCFGEDGKLCVTDVWESREAFDAFAKTLLPIIKNAGVDGGEPKISAVRNSLGIED